MGFHDSDAKIRKKKRSRDSGQEMGFHDPDAKRRRKGLSFISPLILCLVCQLCMLPLTGARITAVRRFNYPQMQRTSSLASKHPPSRIWHLIAQTVASSRHLLARDARQQSYSPCLTGTCTQSGFLTRQPRIGKRGQEMKRKKKTEKQLSQ